MMENLSKSIRCESVARQCVEEDEYKAIEIIKNRIGLFFRKNASLYSILNGNIEFVATRTSKPFEEIRRAYIHYIAHKYYLDLLFGYNSKKALSWLDRLAERFLSRIRPLLDPRPDVIVTTHFGAYYGLYIISRVIPISVVIAKGKLYNSYIRCRNGLLDSQNINPIVNMKQIYLSLKKKQTILILPDRTNFRNELANIQIEFIGAQFKIQPGLDVILKQDLNALFIWLWYDENYENFHLESCLVKSEGYKRAQFFFKVFEKIFIKSPGQWERIKYINKMILDKTKYEEG